MGELSAAHLVSRDFIPTKPSAKKIMQLSQVLLSLQSDKKITGSQLNLICKKSKSKNWQSNSA
jgi:hypothetical protein